MLYVCNEQSAEILIGNVLSLYTTLGAVNMSCAYFIRFFYIQMSFYQTLPLLSESTWYLSDGTLFLDSQPPEQK